MKVYFKERDLKEFKRDNQAVYHLSASIKNLFWFFWSTTYVLKCKGNYSKRQSEVCLPSHAINSFKKQLFHRVSKLLHTWDSGLEDADKVSRLEEAELVLGARVPICSMEREHTVKTPFNSGHDRCSQKLSW